MQVLDTIKFCKSTATSCCPTLSFTDSDTEPLLIKDDFDGEIQISIHDFFLLTNRIKKMVEVVAIANLKATEDSQHRVISSESPYDIKIGDSKIEVEVWRNPLDKGEKVKEITVEEWLFFEEGVKVKYGVS